MKKIVALFAVLLTLGLPASAAVTPNSAVTPQVPVPVNGVAMSTNGLAVLLFTAGSNGAVCNAMTGSTNSTTAPWFFASFSGSASSWVFVSAGVASQTPTNWGNTDILSLWPGLAKDNNGNPSLLLAAGQTLYGATSNLSGGSVANWYVACANF